MTTALDTVLRHFPRAKALLRRLRNMAWRPRGVSSSHVELKSDEVAREMARLSGAWPTGVLPQRQRRLVDRQLAEFRRGVSVDVFDVMLKALRRLPESADGMSLLEVGCSSGYYAEVLEIAGMNIAYAGCDFSNTFIAMARQKNPALRFVVEDATALSFKDDAFD